MWCGLLESSKLMPGNTIPHPIGFIPDGNHRLGRQARLNQRMRIWIWDSVGNYVSRRSAKNWELRRFRFFVSPKIIWRGHLNRAGFSGNFLVWVKLHQPTSSIGNNMPFQIQPVGYCRSTPAVGCQIKQTSLVLETFWWKYKNKLFNKKKPVCSKASTLVKVEETYLTLTIKYFPPLFCAKTHKAEVSFLFFGI